MDWGSDKDLLVDLIRFASIVSAAIFGLIGLFTDYKKDGKTTRWGHLAAGGIALSAVLAMTSAVLQDTIAEEERKTRQQEADRQRGEEEAKFNQQIGALTRLNVGMKLVADDNRTLVANMKSSLESQGVLLARARQSMLLTAGLGMQERRNTGRVMRTLWQDANRVQSSGIELLALYGCPIQQGGSLPRLMSEGVSAKLGLTPAGALGKVVLPITGFESQLLLKTQTTVKLSAYRHDFGWEDSTFGFHPAITHSMRFGPFIGDTLGPFTDIENWRGAAVEVVLTAPLHMTEAEFKALFPMPFWPRKDLLEFYQMPHYPHWPDYRVDAPPCDGAMMLMVNGRIMAKMLSPLVILSIYEGDTPTLTMKSHAVLVDDSSLPRFADAD